MTKILNRFTDKIICEDDLPTKELAIKNKADLGGANLEEANLRGADLREADLLGAMLDNKKIITFKQINQIGDSKRQLFCFYLENEIYYFITGCFAGLEEELKLKVVEKYGNDCEYLEAIEFLKNLCKKYK